jgi:voltage-gated potassium channel
VVLITEGDAPKDLPHDLLDSRTFFHHKGDYTRIEVLEAVGAPNAATAILLTDHSIPRSDQDRDARTVLAALTMERMAPNLYTVAEVTSRQSESLLSMAGVEEIVVGDWYAGMILGSASRNRGLVGVLDEVLSHSHGNAFHTVKIPMSRAGSTIAKLRQELHDTHEATLIALHSGEQRLVNPPGTRRLAIGDQAVVLSADPPHLR